MEEIKKKPGVGVGIMILKEGKVLLGKRNDDAQKASSELHGEGSWTMPGGKLHFQEELEEAAIREVVEETGISLDKDNLKIMSITNDKVSDAHFVTIGFLCENFDGEPKTLEPDEITEWKWFSLDNLPDYIYSTSEKMLNKFISKKTISI